MLPRTLAWAAAALLVAACRGAGESTAAPEPEAQAGTGNFVPDTDVGARFAPGVDALKRAVLAGEDDLARALIAQLDSLGPDEKVWNLARAFERILDGRAAVRTLELGLVCLSEPPGTVLPGAQAGAQVWRLVFRARNTGADGIQLHPGPATLTTTRTDVARRGGESSSLETRSFDKLKRIELAPGQQSEVELARFFLDPPAGQLAVRLAFALELRSGVLVRGGRELPAMRVAVQPARAVRRSSELPQELLSPEQLLAASAGLTSSEELLALAVRTEPEPAGLADLERALAELPRPNLELWIPSVRWLAGSGAPTDVDGLRGWLRARAEAEAHRGPRPALVLPREGRAPEPERN